MRSFNTGFRSFALMASAAAMPMMMAADDAGSESFSLADLADLDLAEIQEIRFEQIPAGVYEWEVTSAELVEGTDRDDAKRYHADFVTKIVGVKAVLEPNVDKESLIGKTISTKFYIHPGKPAEDVQKALGRLRAFITDIGCDSAGKLGDNVRNTKGHFFTAPIKKEKDRDDKSIEYSKLKVEPAKK